MAGLYLAWYVCARATFAVWRAGGREELVHTAPGATYERYVRHSRTHGRARTAVVPRAAYTPCICAPPPSAAPRETAQAATAAAQQ